jgi:succinate dehydrogenase/fumarate reductase flavoprotein subunit
MKTTVEGLYAVGDCSYCGSGVAGAVPSPPGRNRGSGILNAVFAAIQAADEIGHDDISAPLRPISDEQAQAAFDHFNAPLHRKTGVTAKQVIALVQQAMAPVEQSVWMHKDRMAKAMTYVEQAEKLLPEMSAVDPHGALECLEAEAMVLSATMHYRASEMRKESRGWCLREDYPEMDNENWHKWIVVQNVDGEMRLFTEEIPPERWPCHN